MTSVVNVSGGGIGYVGGLVWEKSGKNISGDVYDIGLSPDENTLPTEWITTPSAVSTNSPGLAPFTKNGVLIPVTAQRYVQLLVSDTTPLGTYVCWVRVHDSPEIIPWVIDGPFDVQ
jgi:hypothetical protein